MYKGNDSVPTSGRPGMFSADQRSEIERQHVLDGLEGQLASRETLPPRRKSLLALLITGAAVLTLCAGAVLVLASEEDKQIVFVGSAAQAPEPSVATPAPVADVPQDEAVQAESESPVSEAEVPAPATAQEAMPVKQVPVKHQSRPAKAVIKPLAFANKSSTRPATAADNDVALLTALVAHAKATQPHKGLAAKLRQCKALAAAGAARRCRIRVCAAAAGAAECKAGAGGKQTASG